MKYFDDEVALMSRFDAMFRAAFPNIPIDYMGHHEEPDPEGRLVKFRVVRAITRQVGLGNDTGSKPKRNYGSVLISITYPTGGGPADILDMADFVSGIYVMPDGKYFRGGGVSCRTASLTGPVEVGPFLQATVDVPFTSDYYQ
jgi:hypothetical protein